MGTSVAQCKGNLGGISRQRGPSLCLSSVTTSTGFYSCQHDTVPFPGLLRLSPGFGCLRPRLEGVCACAAVYPGGCWC
jgi:hypothetical protein